MTLEKVVHFALFLGSDLSGYITGTTLFPDGGVNAARGWFNWPGGHIRAIPGEILSALMENGD